MGKRSGPDGTAGRYGRKRNRPTGRALGRADIVAAAAALLAAAAFIYALAAPDGRVTVFVEDRGRAAEYRVWPCTVSELLDRTGMSPGPGDRLRPEGGTPVAEGMRVKVTRAYPVAVSSGGKCRVLMMSSGTVGDALALAGVERKSGDELSALPFEDTKPGMKISHTAVKVSYAISYRALDYDEVIKKDDGKYESFRKVLQEGRDGKKRITQRITVKDGTEASREVVDQIVTEEAVDRIVLVGTKIRYQTSLTGETRRWKEPPKDGVNGWRSMKVDKITAYDTGSRTATGTRPKLGTIAVNPYYFPYGTQFYVPGYGYGVARDTGAFRNYLNDAGKPMNQLDLWMNTRKESNRWGVKRGMTIWYKK